MTQTDTTNKEIQLVQDAPDASTSLANTQPTRRNIGQLMRRTIFDLTADEMQRLQMMARMYQASSFNSSRNPQSEGDFFLIMMKGLELGIAPMAAVDTINIISGKPTLDAKGMLAIVKASGLLEDIDIDSTKERCIVKLKRQGQSEQIVSFTIQEAQQFKTTGWVNGTKKTISLAEKDNWQSQPAVMLKWRAVTKAMREVFPDILSGLYTQEELDPDHTIVNDDGSMLLSDDLKQFGQPDAQPWYKNPDNISKLVSWSQAENFATNEPELLSLIGKKDWTSFESGKEAWATIKQIGNELANEASTKQNGKSDDKTSEKEAETEAPIEPTWTGDDREKFASWLKKHFDKDIETALNELPAEDFKPDLPIHYANAEEAIAQCTVAAIKHEWDVIVEGFEILPKGKGGIVEFDTVLGSMRVYSRSKFATMVGDEFEAMNELDIAELDDGEYATTHIMLSWKQNKNGKIVTNAIAFDPYADIPL